MPTPITNIAFSVALVDIIQRFKDGAILESAAAVEVATLVDNWTLGATSETQLGQQLSNVLGKWNLYVEGQLAWLTITATGGPHSDGTVDLVDYLGNISTVPSLAKLTGAAMSPVENMIVAVGDESTPISVGVNKIKFRMPYGFVLTAVRASLSVASSSGLVTVDINEAGTSILSTKLSIDATELTSTTATTPAVISDANLADDAEMSMDIDAAGTGAAGLKVILIGRRAS